ncbi:MULTISPECIES: DUF4350 domain-containing protein [unclassified Pseudoxanthomonas]|uniref:DUF4350 domain-containing protein n=1 Tax=unclassified Pseudoxanthomonas TaxID=2645906 RepID=UPI003076D8C6
MNRFRRIALIALLVSVVVAAAAAVAWFLHTHHRVDRVLYLPPHGEAGYNPLYALKQTLQADGVKVQARQRLNLADHALGPRDTLLIYNDPRTLSPPEARRLLDWVATGGHLLVRTPAFTRGGTPYADLLDAVGVVPMTDAAECQPFKVEGEDQHIEFCGGRRFGFDEVEPELSWGDFSDGFVYARMTYEEGHVDVLADFDFMLNGGPSEGLFGGDPTKPPQGGLRDGPHRALARQVLAPNYGQGTVHLVYAAQMPSLFRRVLLEGWMVWLPLLAALLAWLWMRMQRFGPEWPAPAAERRSLLEHVRASGEHLFRYGRGVLLYSAVRNAFLARLRRRHPVAAALTGEPQIAAIAERFGLSDSVVRTALQTPAGHDKQAFRDRISTLIQLRNRL